MGVCFYFISFLIFSALLGEPSKAADCETGKCTIAQLGFGSRRIKSIVGAGEGQRRKYGGEGQRRKEHGFAESPKLEAGALDYST